MIPSEPITDPHILTEPVRKTSLALADGLSADPLVYGREPRPPSAREELRGKILKKPRDYRLSVDESLIVAA